MAEFKKESFLFVSGLIGGSLSHCLCEGMKGTKGVTIPEAILNGIPVASQLSSFALSSHILSKISPYYKEQMDNPKGNKLVVYALGGAGASLIFTTLTYPSKVMISKKKDKNAKITFQGAKSFYFDRLGISIGFPMAMDYLQENVPMPQNSLMKWIRGHALVHLSNVSGRIIAYPILHVRYGSTLNGMISNYLNNHISVCLTGDCVSVVKPPLMSLLK